MKANAIQDTIIKQIYTIQKRKITISQIVTVLSVGLSVSEQNGSNITPTLGHKIDLFTNTPITLMWFKLQFLAVVEVTANLP